MAQVDKGSMGQQHAAGQVEVMELTASSQQQRQKHEAVLLDLAAKKVAATVDVPTLPEQVRATLRQLGLPVRLFGENLANVRDRLRMELARRQVGAEEILKQEEQIKREQLEEEEEVTKYTRATPALIEARQAMTAFSVGRAAKRLNAERELRSLALMQRKRNKIVSEEDEKQQAVDDSILSQLDAKCIKLSRQLRQVGLSGSQYGDSRALSSICTQSVAGIPLVATASWSGSIHLWDGRSSAIEPLGQKTLCHEDRVMGISMIPLDHDDALIATASIDMTGKLWKITKSYVVMNEDEEESAESSVFSITEASHLTGHAARLCRTAFHPMKRHVATTSFDHTWRLWDVETGKNILLQDGHWKECYGVGFHPDGSLCSTSDFSGVVHVWDLRTGKSIKHFMGHAKRVLNTEFHPNGFQLATSGDDGTIKIWDLRKRKMTANIPAHSNLITNTRFDATGEYMVSSSFDGTVCLWGARDWKMLNRLHGHDGKVSGADILEDHSIISCGFDKTLKLWS
ncbi:U4/U6 small nuclear ribonucleoprotein PRP4 [Fistulifera solaris]|jgi:U4/U6 small nuclear ribonucleoprotein PRP4|uniref:U4/U6 small nuclear ribonucleoprotein PRP4 n=1 Tax=Fistulifera solaris TaxID=1519565 RepID=A0A1Z5JSU9_FISSO|nr:U4/U6 small nuclear ribonucleoprotein PRP4 [Fistulifera solaris]|eukprot:GAX17105.1 U4/U6 small nuclear ribonucleoprotein PRP4 [Fistulifera solaris]